MKIKSKGFTLIELLVVIAIISLLSSVVLASLKDARGKAKLSAFQQEVDQFVLAVELYKSDNNGSFPSDDFYIVADSTSVSGVDKFDSYFKKYISKFPIPYSGGAFLYYQSTNGFTCNGSITFVEVYGLNHMEYFKDWTLVGNRNNWIGYGTQARCLPI